MPSEEKIALAKSHLRVALLQSLPADDQIIIGHIREALEALESPIPPEPIQRCPSCHRRVTAPGHCLDCQNFAQARTTCLSCEAPLTSEYAKTCQTCETCRAKERAGWDASTDRVPR